LCPVVASLLFAGICFILHRKATFLKMFGSASQSLRVKIVLVLV
jgi:hypothetical protein